MDYREHPLLQGFKDLPDDQLLASAIAQLDMAAWIKAGAKNNKPGLAPGIAEAIEEGFQDASRESLEKFFYHCTLAALRANQEARAAGNSTSPEGEV